MATPAKYIVLEGIDGTGKSTLARSIANALASLGDVVVTEEPTRTGTGARIRKLLTDHATSLSVDDWLELFESDRADHMANVVQPALARGAWVVQDRSFYSTAAYQGAQGADVRDVLRRNRQIAIEPGLVLILTLDPAESLRRAHVRRGQEAELFEREDFLGRVSAIFASLKGANIAHIDARPGAEVVLASAMTEVRRRFPSCM